MQKQKINVEQIEHELFASVNHSMMKNHYVSFLAYVTCDRIQLVKMYPEQNAECRFIKTGHGVIYAYCNNHGLFKVRV